jgi:hypothetical protein
MWRAIWSLFSGGKSGPQFSNDAERLQFLEKSLMEAAFIRDRPATDEDVGSGHWPTLSFRLDGVEYGVLEQVTFAPPFLVVTHIKTSQDHEAKGYRKAIAEGLKAYAEKKRVEKIFFTEPSQTGNQPAFFASIGAIALPPNTSKQISPDYLFMPAVKNESQRCVLPPGITAAETNAILAADKAIMSLLRNVPREVVKTAIAELKAQSLALSSSETSEAYQEIKRIDLARALLSRYL